MSGTKIIRRLCPVCTESFCCVCQGVNESCPDQPVHPQLGGDAKRIRELEAEVKRLTAERDLLRRRVQRLNVPMVARLRKCAADDSPNWDGKINIYPREARQLTALIDAAIRTGEPDAAAQPSVGGAPVGAGLDGEERG